MLDREGAAEAAALGLAREADPLDVGELVDQGVGVAGDAHLAARMAGGVDRDLLGRSEIIQPHVEHVHQELGQLVDPA